MPYLILVLSIFVLTPAFAQTTNSAAWVIKKTEWTPQDEKNYQAFVQRLGEKVERRGCNTVRNCFLSDANIYRKSDPPGLHYKADCADFPYYVRGYFAWKNGLPFSFANNVRPRQIPGNSTNDRRYSRYGNEVVSRYSVASSRSVSALTVFNNIIPNQTDSGNFRMNFTGNDSGPLFSDFYPVRIDREAIQVGTVLYDPNGHVALVYKVTADGKAYYIDAHPDNSLTMGAFSVKFIRSHPGQGAGFKNWRPLKLVNAQRDSQGNFIGGQIIGSPNSVLADYGIEQFFGTNGTPQTDWRKAEFIKSGKKLSFHEFVRESLADGQLRIHPVDDYRETLGDLCISVQDRVHAVDRAIQTGVSRKPHPVRLPENIYGTQGEWEEFSTPSRDAQLKVSYRDLLDQVSRYFEKLSGGDPSIVYAGSAEQLRLELLDVYLKESRSCQIQYTNSVGQAVSLDLEEVRQRLFKLSFSPYHCAELRWGAESAVELSNCPDDSNKRLWYERQQQLRNQHERRYDVRMDYSLEDLKTLQPVGRAQPMDVDIVNHLESFKGIVE